MSLKSKSFYSPQYSTRMSARKFVDEINNPSKRSNIKAISFITPKLGTKGYGSFEITYRTPVLTEDVRKSFG